MARRKKVAAPYRATRSTGDVEAAMRDATEQLEAAIRTLCQRFARKALEDALGGPITPRK